MTRACSAKIHPPEPALVLVADEDEGSRESKGVVEEEEEGSGEASCSISEKEASLACSNSTILPEHDEVVTKSVDLLIVSIKLTIGASTEPFRDLSVSSGFANANNIDFLNCSNVIS